MINEKKIVIFLLEISKSLSQMAENNPIIDEDKFFTDSGWSAIYDLVREIFGISDYENLDDDMFEIMDAFDHGQMCGDTAYDMLKEISQEIKEKIKEVK